MVVTIRVMHFYQTGEFFKLKCYKVEDIRSFTVFFHRPLRFFEKIGVPANIESKFDTSSFLEEFILMELKTSGPKKSFFCAALFSKMQASN